MSNIHLIVVNTATFLQPGLEVISSHPESKYSFFDLINVSAKTWWNVFNTKYNLIRSPAVEKEE